MRLWLFPAIVLAMLSLPDARAGWGGRSCAAVAAPAVQAPVPDAGTWHSSNKWPGWNYWIQGGQLRAWHEPATGRYQEADARGNLIEKAPPWPAAPIAAIGDLPKWQTDAVDLAKLSLRERITINGREASQADALDAIGKPGGPVDIPDDAKRLRLTLIGTEAERARVLAELPPTMRDSYVVQSYPPGDWALRPGFVQHGSPTIYLQAPPEKPGGSGKALLRLDRWEGAASIMALRKADPLYKPDADPDGKPKLPPAPVPSPVGPAVSEPVDPLAALAVLALAGGGLVLFHRSQQSKTPEPRSHA